LGNTFSFLEIKDKIIAEIGCGNGRIVHMLQKLNPSKTHVVEPVVNLKLFFSKIINFVNF
jgi:tRNA G46 methylase TrmB